MSSFRSRIRYSTLGLIAALLVTFAVGVWWGFKNVLQQYVDSRLQAIAEAWSGIVERNAAMLLDLAQKGDSDVRAAVPEGEVQEEQLELREAALSILVLDLSGRVVWKGAAVGTTPPLDPSLLVKVSHGQPVFDTIIPSTGPAIRRVSVPIHQQGEVRYILQAETSLRLAEKALNGLVVLLGVASALTLALAWFGSGWLAQQVLMPVEALSATAQTVSESSLGTRLSLDAPYEEFRRLVHAFNTMMDRLQKVFEAQRRFLADAAHEIQTPLTVLKGNLEVAFRKKRSASEYREVLISNLGQVERLISLSRSLITLARCVGEDASSERRSLALEPLVRNLVSELAVLADDRKIHIDLKTEAVAPVLGNEGQLKRVLINLIDNALRYTPPGGTVSIGLHSDGQEATITVRDNGPGIAPEHLPHIFERFYRADSARARDSGGTGLGLAIVKEIVEAHGGRIEVESVCGVGSCFAIRLPVSAVPDALDASGRGQVA